MSIRTLSILYIVLGVCVSASCDVMTPYLEGFNAGTNEDWGTDHALVTNLFGTNFIENGALHRTTGGLSNTGYDYTNFAWVAGNWNLIFADADASGGNLAGNKDYSNIPSLSAWLEYSYTQATGVTTTFFFASTEDSGTDITAASNQNLFYWNSTFFPTQSWAQYSADLTNTGNWTRMTGTGTFANSIQDVDLVGILFLGSATGSPEMRVDNFTATPEPGLFLTMAPLAGFLGWRLRRGRKKEMPAA